MSVKRDSPGPPPGLSPADEARWWDEHWDYWEALDTPLEFVGRSKIHHTEEVKLYLPENMLAAIQQEAEKRAVHYQTLMRTWLKERLETEQPRRPPAAAPPGE